MAKGVLCGYISLCYYKNSISLSFGETVVRGVGQYQGNQGSIIRSDKLGAPCRYIMYVIRPKIPLMGPFWPLSPFLSFSPFPLARRGFWSGTWELSQRASGVWLGRRPGGYFVLDHLPLRHKIKMRAWYKIPKGPDEAQATCTIEGRYKTTLGSSS